MDPYAPIQGISLERYAELGAQLDGIADPGAQLAKVESLGVSAADWQAAQKGWTARMQDIRLMGQVASRYMQLFNAAVSKNKGTVSVGFEDWCVMSAFIQVHGPDALCAQYKISQGDWTSMSAHWTTELSRDPMNLAVRRNQLQQAEAARLSSGGEPKPITVSRGAAGGAPAGGAAAFDPHAQMQMQMQAGAQQQQASMQHAAAALGQAGVQGALGIAGAMNAMMGGSSLVPGRQVSVQWNDGNRYPATLMQLNGAQGQVVFPDGRQMWIETQYLTPA